MPLCALPPFQLPANRKPAPRRTPPEPIAALQNIYRINPSYLGHPARPPCRPVAIFIAFAAVGISKRTHRSQQSVFHTTDPQPQFLLNKITFWGIRNTPETTTSQAPMTFHRTYQLARLVGGASPGDVHPQRSILPLDHLLHTL